jgi:hypothetical protein
MPDIGQPYPIKPVWPTRPENQTGRRKRPHKDSEHEDNGQTEEEQPQEQPRERPGGTPHIDDYA